MSRNAEPAIDEDIREAVDEDERVALIAELRDFVDDAEDSLGLA